MLKRTACCFLVLGFLVGCGSDDDSNDGSGGTSSGGASGSGGANASGGAPSSGGTGGTTNGTGGTSGSGGTVGTGGAASGGAPGTGGSGGAPTSSICPGGPYDSPLPSADARAENVATVSSNNLLEGALWMHDMGVLLFSEMNWGTSASTIYQLDPSSGEASVFIQPDTGTNGLAIGPDGNILAASHDPPALVVFDKTSKMKQSGAYVQDDFLSPNDLTVRSDGNVYFTDPDFNSGQSNVESRMGVYRVAPDKQLTPIDSIWGTQPYIRPNGISLSPDEDTLYVAGSDGKVRQYPVAADGSVGTGTMFADVGPGMTLDGMAIDCAGNLYVTAHQQGKIYVYDSTGADVGEITAAPSVTNAAFGGAERKTLFITAGNQILEIELNVPGFPY